MRVFEFDACVCTFTALWLRVIRLSLRFYCIRDMCFLED